MTDPRRQAFAPYVRQLADLMGLKDWHFRIDDEAPADWNAFATFRPCLGRKQAWIDLGGCFLEATPDRQRQTVVHELLHAHGAPMREALMKMLTPDQLAVHTIHLEYMVDGIAEEWAKSLPLP